MPDEVGEPRDDHMYHWVSFSPDTFKLMLAATRFYKQLLDADIQFVLDDPELAAVIKVPADTTTPLSRERRSVEWHLARLERKLEECGSDAWDYDFDLSHGQVRFFKSVSLLYLERLRDRRDALAARPGISTAVLAAVDEQLAMLDEKLELGVFHKASPRTLSISQLPAVEQSAAAPVEVARTIPPVRVDSIDVRDEQLRARCLDLLAQFEADGAHERLDTVVSEATRILEDRLRSLSGADAQLVGVDLAKFAFSPPDNAIALSDIPAEQEAAHLLFRGVFGFIRNTVHHRLVENLQPQRVLQVLGMIDYLIFVAENGVRREEPPAVV